MTASPARLNYKNRTSIWMDLEMREYVEDYRHEYRFNSFGEALRDMVRRIQKAELSQTSI